MTKNLEYKFIFTNFFNWALYTVYYNIIHELCSGLKEFAYLFVKNVTKLYGNFCYVTAI